MNKTARRVLLLVLGGAALYYGRGLLGVAPCGGEEVITARIGGAVRAEKSGKVYKVRGAGGSFLGTAVLSESVSGNITGYAGKLPVLVFIKPDDTIGRVEVLQNTETPEYLEFLRENGFLGRYPGKSVRSAFPLEEDAAAWTGATYSAAAINNGVRDSLKYYLDGAVSPPPSINRLPEYLAVALGLLLAFASLYLRGPFLKYLTMIYAAAALGFFFRIYLSVNDIYSGLSGGFKFAYFSPFLLLACVVFAALVLGRNIYCSFLCPFGALSELLHRALKFLKVPVYSSRPGRLRYLKYILLAGYLLYLLPSGRYYTLEPYMYVFSGIYSGFFSLIAAALLLYSAVDHRFYCRNLCLLAPLFRFVSRLRG